MQPAPNHPQQPAYPAGQPVAPGTPGYPTPPPPKKRSRLLIVLATLGVLGLVCCGGIAVVAMNGDDKTDSSSADGGAGGGSDGGSGSGNGGGGNGAKPKATLGMAVRDGKFEFVVSDATCGKSTLGSAPLSKPAQGQFCLVTLKVKNIGNKAQTFSDNSQKAFGSTGAQYSTDTAAGLYANQNANVFLNEINPGNEITGVLVFDIPKDAKLVKLELHDSPFSGGVEVTLG